MEQLQVVAHCGLGKSDGIRQVADTRLRVRLGRDDAHELQARRVGQDPQHRSQRVGLTRREGRFEHRLTAILDLGDELHLVILTAIDTTVKISTAVDAKEAQDDLRGPELPAGLLPTGLLLGRSMPGSLPAERRPSSSGRRRSWRL